MKTVLIAVALLLASFALCAAEPVKIFFDTDMENDCDDSGALTVLHALADKGECEILATVVSVLDPNSAATVDAISTCHDRATLPLGSLRAGFLRGGAARRA